MKRFLLTLSAALMVAALGWNSEAAAQCGSGNCGAAGNCGANVADDCTKRSCGCCYFSGANGMVQPICPPGKHAYVQGGMLYAAHDHFSPHPIYAYSRHGIDAGRIHAWNQRKAAEVPWHANYNYWRWGAPTALVVPPTAGFHTEYNWGVGQTRSMPIYHQFGRNGAGTVAAGQGGFQNTPYWPSSTRQFGVYPVRAPW